MLWYKSWRETRFRVVWSLFFIGLFLGLLRAAGIKAPDGVRATAGMGWIFAATVSIMLAGAGIVTQPGLQANKGLHGSTLFTLSLPASRLRLLAVRAGLGWFELAAMIATMCCGLWTLFPVLRSAVTAGQMIQYTAVLLVCTSALYAIPVLLATFVDEQWRFFGSAFLFAALWWLSSHTLPASADIFRAMGEGSPLLAHTMPWTALGVSAASAAILFWGALKIARAREY